MDVLQQTALYGVIYLLLIIRCVHYCFPKTVIMNMDESLLIFFERRFRLLRNLTLGLMVVLPPLLGIVVEVLPRELKLSACSIGIIIALSAGFFFIEFRSYLAVIQKQQKVRDTEGGVPKAPIKRID